MTNKLLKAVVVTGTPGTGKTALSKKLAAERGWKYIDVNEVIAEHKLSVGNDRKRGVDIVDEGRLARVLAQMIKSSPKKLVIDSHLSHYVTPALVTACIITTCPIVVLERRLKKKGYTSSKIKENVEAELLGICQHEAEDLGHKIIIVNTSRKVDLKALRVS
ncbi:MAG TPA: adenylate kinase family protein [Candidatus Nanoarchaeia archaeon]|nr:adenylate kinase family protein [Candidatus Nanoarchaeia archaeon]